MKAGVVVEASVRVDGATGRVKRDVVVALLDHWPEFFDVAGGTAAVVSGDSGGGLTLLSSMSRHPSVVELGRCLEVVRGLARGHYRWVLAYFGAPWRTTDRPVKRKTVGGGRVVVELVRVRERVLPHELRRFSECSCCSMPRPVCLAVDVVCGSWNPDVPLELPRPLMAKLTTAMDPVSGEEVWTERRPAA